MNLSTRQVMKIVAIILMTFYLLLPVICFGHPSETVSTSSQDSHLGYDGADRSPLQPDADNCGTTCCCAGHVPLAAFTVTRDGVLTAGQLPYEPDLALPRLIERIFVPPQNLS